jgi:hypothetical protein
MKLAALMCLGVSSCLAMTPANHAHAQSPATCIGSALKALTCIGTIAITTYIGIRAADAAKKEGAQGGPGLAPSPQKPLQGIVYKLGPEWKVVTSAGYCVSYYPGFCSPCDWDGSFCGGRLNDEVFQIAQ